MYNKPMMDNHRQLGIQRIHHEVNLNQQVNLEI